VAGSGRAGHASVIDTSAITRLKVLANNWTSANGDPTPSSALVVLTLAGRAGTAITGDPPSEPDVTLPVYLISMTGKFTWHGPAPAGSEPVTGTEFDIVVDARTFRILQIGLKPTATTDVSALGTPIKLTW
jgi:hypothetical protein